MSPFDGLALYPCIFLLLFLCLILSFVNLEPRESSPPLLPRHSAPRQYTSPSPVNTSHIRYEPRPQPILRPPPLVERPVHTARPSPAVGQATPAARPPVTRHVPSPWLSPLPQRTYSQAVSPHQARLPQAPPPTPSQRVAAEVAHHRRAAEARVVTWLESASTTATVDEGHQSHAHGNVVVPQVAVLPQQQQPPAPARDQESRNAAVAQPAANARAGARRGRRRRREATPPEADAAVLSDNEERQSPSDSQDPDYRSLRAAANAAKESARAHFKTRDAAYQRGDRWLEQLMSNAGEESMKEAERLDAQASAIVFKLKNKGLPPRKVDLHRLYVKEAERYALQSIERCKADGLSELWLIVGKGNHAVDGISKLRPAIEKLVRQQGYEPKSAPRNAGVVVVRFKPARQRRV